MLVYCNIRYAVKVVKLETNTNLLILHNPMKVKIYPTPSKAANLKPFDTTISNASEQAS